MKKVTRTIVGITMLALLGISVSRCSKNNSTSAVSTNVKQIKLQSTAALANFLVDKDGRTLYSFASDVDGASTCTGSCGQLWPPFYVDNLTADELGNPALKTADFGVITTSANNKQLTYKGWPLYHYAPNGAPEPSGQTNGDGVDGLWFVAKADYTITLANKQLIGGDNNHYKSDYTLGEGNTIYFTDAIGNTLYTFSRDSADKNKFTKSDFSNNGIFAIYDTTNISVPSILDKSLFAATNVFGRNQLTYKGWPLYHFGDDEGARGSTKGITFGAPGKWPVPVKNISAAPAQ
jgi:predicted lipoprotein with Yx(FWY)xxD motif